MVTTQSSPPAKKLSGWLSLQFSYTCNGGRQQDSATRLLSFVRNRQTGNHQSSLRGWRLWLSDEFVRLRMRFCGLITKKKGRKWTALKVMERNVPNQFPHNEQQSALWIQNLLLKFAVNSNSSFILSFPHWFEALVEKKGDGTNFYCRKRKEKKKENLQSLQNHWFSTCRSKLPRWSRVNFQVSPDGCEENK